MPGFQHIRYVSGEREIHLMANIKPGHVKGVISSDSIDLQEVAAGIVIRISMVVLNKPLRVLCLSRAGIEIVLPAMFGNHKFTGIYSGNNIKALNIP